MKPYILAFTVFLMGMYSVELHAQAGGPSKSKSSKSRIQATSKTTPVNASTTHTPLHQQNILVNIKTGRRTSIEKVLQSTTAAGHGAFYGASAPGGGYYYTPGPANRVGVPQGSSGAAAGTTVGGNNGLGFMNQDMFGGGLVLLSGVSIFQPFANLGSPKTDDICEECAELGTSVAPSRDPALTPANTMPSAIRSGMEHVYKVFSELGEFPFQNADGSFEAYYLAALYDTLMREPFSEIADISQGELKEFCPNYENLDYVKRNAIIMLLFSNIMKDQNGGYTPNRTVSFNDADGRPQTGHGLCAIREDSARSLVADYQGLIRNPMPSLLDPQSMRTNYVTQEFGVFYNQNIDLYDAQNNIKLCVMEMHSSATVLSQGEHRARPFSFKSEVLSNAALKEKFRNYSICKGPNAPVTASTPATSGTVVHQLPGAQ